MRSNRTMKLLIIVAGATLPLLVHAAGATQAASAKELARGKYLVMIGGCNDCHTPGYGLAPGEVAEKDWLIGSRLGWRGPWGTTYAVNVRQYMQGLTEAQWLAKAKTLTTRPPMPWQNVRAMSVSDLRAMYRYVRHLGPAGDSAPAYLAPDTEPPPPFVTFPAPPK